MENGRTTGTSPHSFTPSVKHLAVALLVGTALVISGTRDEKPPQPSTSQAFTAPVVAPPSRSGSVMPPAIQPARSSVAQLFTAPVRPAPSRTALAAPPAVQPLPPSDPVRIHIPAIRVDALMMKLKLDAAGALEPPPVDNPALAGWYAAGTSPGSVGTALVAGHVDTRVGPGVFHALGSLAKGATIDVVRADLRTAVFTVRAVEVYAKKDFPDKKVYGPSPRPELRVITCGGGYDKKTGYESNVVVYATLTAVKGRAS
ncbi:class F sortase [Streptomyces sp. NPDC048560]|uniref:class F sortase n=1 Tax=Streptomyces sp. NPDC048560 TaxID=3155488 RepID=UPI003433DBDF